LSALPAGANKRKVWARTVKEKLKVQMFLSFELFRLSASYKLSALLKSFILYGTTAEC